LVTVSLCPLSTAALVQNTSTEVNTLMEIGNALDGLGNYSGAIQYYDKALAINPKHISALNNKGAALDSLGHDKALALDGLGNYSGAIQYYDKALAINPNNAALLYNKGLALHNQSNYTR
jgi:tetratricopeptide (TPR) repeat protein